MTLDTNTINKILKQPREFIVEQKPDKKMITNHTIKIKLVSERKKAIGILDTRWEKMEELRIRILIEMKTLKGFNDNQAVLKLENTRLSGIHAKLIESKVSS